MKKYFIFDNNANWKLFENALLSWIGTPYRHGQHVKGRGTDCTAYIASSLLEAGFVKKIVFPKYYPKDWMNLDSHSTMLYDIIYEHLHEYTTVGVLCDAYHKTDKKGIPPVIRGDICMFSMRANSMAFNHTGIILGDTKSMMHVSQKAKVRVAPYNQVWQDMLAVVFRLVEIK